MLHQQEQVYTDINIFISVIKINIRLPAEPLKERFLRAYGTYQTHQSLSLFQSTAWAFEAQTPFIASQ
jgi:hypothetical protein